MRYTRTQIVVVVEHLAQELWAYSHEWEDDEIDALDELVKAAIEHLLGQANIQDRILELVERALPAIGANGTVVDVDLARELFLRSP